MVQTGIKCVKKEVIKIKSILLTLKEINSSWVLNEGK